MAVSEASGDGRVLVVNAGSSSLKLRVLDHDDIVLASADQAIATPNDVEARLAEFTSTAPTFAAVGHRIVHGGLHYRQPTLVTDAVCADLDHLAELAPLHNPPGIAAIRAAIGLWPDRPSIACFDTAFHATIPDAAAVYPVPWAWTDGLGVRRFGFHGLSHEHAAHRGAEILGLATETSRLVTCHLGAGASLAAVHGGRSVDTTMGFTPLEGLMMATRSGSVDPGALLWVQRRLGLDAAAMERVLDRESGLLGVSGVSGDWREVVAAHHRGSRRATLALGIYLHRLRGGVAAMAASMGGLDGVIFTGGVGEHSALVRAQVSEGLAFLGVIIDPSRNETAAGDTDVSARDANVRVAVVEAREDLIIAAQVRSVLAPETSAASRSR